MSSIKPAMYWRASKQWSNWIGRRGEVISATQMQVAVPDLASWTPITLALVDFGDERREFMVAGQATVQSGDQVECVLRKLSEPDDQGVISYGIKVQKLNAKVSNNISDQVIEDAN